MTLMLVTYVWVLRLAVGSSWVLAQAAAAAATAAAADDDDDGD
jgi:hypothetical protein